MREIKYRVWDKKRKTYDEPILDGYVLTQGGVLFGSSVLDDWMTEINEDSVVLEQYTGLKDAEDVEIYENDVIETFDGIRGYVAFDDGTFSIRVDDMSTPLSNYLIFGDLSAEIIGNVHRNPELLEG